MAQRAAPLMWSYSLQWCLPHRPCPCPRELLARHTRPGAPIPPAILDAWKRYQPQGDRVSLDFRQSETVRHGSA